MASKLRPLYDRLYMGIDVGLLALGAAKDGRKRAREAIPVPGLDTLYSGTIRPYWRQFSVPVPKKFWFRAFGPDPRYIPDDLWFRRIIPHFNTVLFAQALQDKCLHNLFVPSIRRPRTIVKNIAGVFYDDELNLLSEEEAVARCHDGCRILAKPSVGSGQGRNIRFYDSSVLSDDEIREIFRQYGRNFILQEKMAQHPTLEALNPNSLNTVRIMTFLFQGNVHILSTILRIGSEMNEVDNVSQGGYQCTIQSTGKLEPKAITKQSGQWVQVEQTARGQRFADVSIPSFDRVLDAVRNAASAMGHFKILGWDIAVDPEGEPVLIEYNVIPGQNQGTCGPTFGDLTDAVLEEVFGTC